MTDTTITGSVDKAVISWPERFSIFGVGVSATDYTHAAAAVIDAAKKRVSSCIVAMPVHGLITAVYEKEFSEAVRTFNMVCPDGQPVRWALNTFHNCGLTDRVYGPTLTLHVLERAEKEGLMVYFYGSKPKVMNALRAKLQAKYPKLIIANMESPPFRKLTHQEEMEAVQRVNSSGASILFVGLGCPKQELFAARNQGKITMPMLCVGAAFDFHAGMLKQAPAWMQK